MKEIIEARLARRRAERDQLAAEHNALRQRLQEVEPLLIRADVACVELEQLLNEMVEEPVDA